MKCEVWRFLTLSHNREKIPFLLEQLSQNFTHTKESLQPHLEIEITLTLEEGSPILVLKKLPLVPAINLKSFNYFNLLPPNFWSIIVKLLGKKCGN